MTNNQRIDDGTAFSGFLLGLLGGGIYALFRGPRLKLFRRNEEGKLEAEDAVKESIQAIMPKDTLKESIAEGKEAAQRYRREATRDR